MTSSQEAELASLTAAVDELHQLEGAALQRRWRTLVGGPVPVDLGRPLILRVLAYKLQAQRLGDLDRASLRELSALYNEAKTGADQGKGGSAEACTVPIVVKAGARTSISAPGSQIGSAPRVARPGTLLVREHGGVLHRVMILEQGVTWNGRTYDSLSQVALAITGTKWNGPRFFGLRDRPDDVAKTQSKRKAELAAEAKEVVIGRGRAAVVSRSSPQRVSP